MLPTLAACVLQEEVVMISLIRCFGKRNPGKGFDPGWMHNPGQLQESLRQDVYALVRLVLDDLKGISYCLRVEFSLKGFGWYTILK